MTEINNSIRRSKWLIVVVLVEGMLVLCYPSENGFAPQNIPRLEMPDSGEGMFVNNNHQDQASLCCGNEIFNNEDKVVENGGLELEQLDMNNPESANNGTGGVYFLKDKIDNTRKVVFKPAEEENDTTNKDGYMKEYAAYVIDNGIAAVPETELAVLDIGKGPQIGSAQRFVQDSEDAEDFGCGMFDIDDIQNIAVLDIRILNMDRHSGNLMRNKITGKLVPIDHGTSFPSAFEKDQLGKASFEWLMYPQAKKPISESLLKAIDNIDLTKDLEAIANAGLDEGVQLSTWMSTTLLKVGAKHGKTLYEIGSMIQRKGDRSEPSKFELLYHKALDACEEEDSCDFFQHFQKFVEQEIKQEQCI